MLDLVKELRSVFSASVRFIETRHLVDMCELATDIGKYELQKLEEKHKKGVDAVIPSMTELFTSCTLGMHEVRIVTALISPCEAIKIKRLIDRLEKLLEQSENKEVC